MYRISYAALPSLVHFITYVREERVDLVPVACEDDAASDREHCIKLINMTIFNLVNERLFRQYMYFISFIYTSLLSPLNWDVKFY